MGGHGHGVHIHYNHHAKQETDEEMQQKIQLIELIKFNPMHFHMGFYDFNSWNTVLGGAPTYAFGAAGAAISYSYFASQSRPHNVYMHITRSFGRIFLGAFIGMTYGFFRFGDRQKLHNAWVSERLLRRYPESMELREKNLWRCKGVKQPQEFYRWI